MGTSVLVSFTRRCAYRQAAIRGEVKQLRDKMLADLAEGRLPRREATVGQLLDAVLEAADLDASTRVICKGHVGETIRLGGYRVGYLEQQAVPGVTGPAVRRAEALPSAVRRAPRPH